MKTGRRTQKTIRAIENTVLHLLCTHRISEIKIVDLCKEADINRTTFYLHFHSVTDVLDTLRREMTEKIYTHEKTNVQDFSETDGTLEFLTACTNTIDSYELFSEFMQKSPDADVFLTCLKNDIAAKLFEHYAERFGAVSEDALIVIRFLTGGVLDVYVEWLKSDKTISLETLLSVCTPIVSAGQKMLEKMLHRN